MKPLATFLAESDLDKHKAFVRKIYSKGFVMEGRAFFGFKNNKTDEEATVLVLLKPMVNSVHFSELIVTPHDKRGQGFGSHVLKMITSEADKMKVRLTGFVKPIDVFGGKKTPISVLRKLYKKHGFHVMTKKERDKLPLEQRLSAIIDDMVREPK